MNEEKPNKFSLMTDYDIGVLLASLPGSYSTDDLRTELCYEAGSRNLIKDIGYTKRK